MADYARGIDVTAAGQGRFDWPRWEGHIDFAIAKATEGLTFVDSEFARNWAHMRAMGIGCLAYHFGHPNKDPAEQARHFTDVLREHGDEDSGAVLDIETRDGLKPIDVAFWAWTFAQERNRLAKHSRLTVIYTFPSFAEEGNLAKSGSAPLWIASPNQPEPDVPLPWKHWAFWQYAWGTGHGTPNLDHFNGTVRELHKFLKSTRL